MTALKITKRAKIAGFASTALAVTSLTVLFVSHSALASTSPKGDTPPPSPTATISYTPPPPPRPRHLHLHEHADGHADHRDAAADHACADADADAGRSGASGGDRLPSSDGLTCRKPMTAGGRAAGQGASAGSG